jgi:hypothetical protein
MLKVSHNAIKQFATVPNFAVAGAIFSLFAARPQIFGKSVLSEDERLRMVQRPLHDIFQTCPQPRCEADRASG